MAVATSQSGSASTSCRRDGAEIGDATLFYEEGKISTRFACKYRSRFVSTCITVTQTQALAGDYADPVSRLDFSFGYSPVRQLTLSFDASNVPATLHQVQRVDGPDLPPDACDESRVFAL